MSDKGVFPGLQPPLLFAHRGASRHAPENTWEAFDLAVRVGADVLELDVHTTRDGEVVVIHDDTVDRTTNGHGRVHDFTYAELSELDAGYRFDAGGHDYRFRGRGVTVPRLADLLAQLGDVACNIEVKQREPAMVARVLEVLARAGATRVVLAAADDAIMRELEAAKPGVPLGLSKTQVLQTVRGAYFGGVPARYAGRALQIPPCFHGLPLATRRVVRAAQAAGVAVHLWTIDDPRRARRLLERGIDGIMSNDPSALADVVIGEKERRAGRALGRARGHARPR